jgi:hypothetical protein
MIQAKADLLLDHSFIVMATAITIVSYDCNSFIVQATGMCMTATIH